MDTTNESLILLAKDLMKSKTLVFTGAGVSTNSGIPDFRGTEGFYKTHHEDDLAIGSLFKNTDFFYEAFQKRFSSVFLAKPNQTHKILASLESDGLLYGIITQNVDRLHHKAGSKNVIEFHGNIFYYDLIKVRPNKSKSYRILEEDIPYTAISEGETIHYRVDDTTFYKPQVVLFGEAISSWSESVQLAKECDVHIIMGTSYLVYPFNMISYENPNAKVYVINNEPIEYKGKCTQIIGDTSDILKSLLKIIKGNV